MVNNRGEKGALVSDSKKCQNRHTPHAEDGLQCDVNYRVSNRRGER